MGKLRLGRPLGNSRSRELNSVEVLGWRGLLLPAWVLGWGAELPGEAQAGGAGVPSALQASRKWRQLG